MARLNGPTDSRVYVRRRGRITRGQSRALVDGYDRYVLPVPATPIDWSSGFGRQAPLLLEIGFGMGHALIETAVDHPEWNCLGVEVYRPGLGAVILRCLGENIGNVRLVEADVRTLLANGIAPNSLSRVHLFFPDPWPKKRHQKRRLVDPLFAATLAERMQVGALLLAATDWQAYAEHMLAVFDAEARLVNVVGRGQFTTDVARASTRFEARGKSLGHQVFDLAYSRSG